MVRSTAASCALEHSSVVGLHHALKVYVYDVVWPNWGAGGTTPPGRIGSAGRVLRPAEERRSAIASVKSACDITTVTGFLKPPSAHT
eukprot:6331165-Prymnesium_polylepis.1